MYYINDEIKHHLDLGADCINRYKHKTSFLDPVTGGTINLLEELEKNQKLDITVKPDNKEKTRVQLVAFPVNEEVANIRRIKVMTALHFFPGINTNLAVVVLAMKIPNRYYFFSWATKGCTLLYKQMTVDMVRCILL